MAAYGVLVISHGSRSGRWVRLVDEAVSRVRLPAGIPIESSFLEIVENRLIPDGIRKLEERGVTDIIVVPLFVSSGSTHIHEIGSAFGVISGPDPASERKPFAVRSRIHFGSPMDDDPLVADILYDKIKDLSVRPEKEIVLLIGHGSNQPGFYDKWRAGTERLAARIRALAGFAAADAALLLPDEAGSRLRHWRTQRPDCDVLVAPLFLSEGYFTSSVIPARLEGLAYRYNGRAMLPHPLVSRWIEKQVGLLLPDSNG